MLTEKSIAHIAALIATGHEGRVKPYLATMIRKGAPFLEYRCQLIDALTPEFWDMALKACPWLADDRFGLSPGGARGTIIEALTEARISGVRVRQLKELWPEPAEVDMALRALEGEGEIVTVTRSTGGRPTIKSYLAKFAPRDDMGERIGPDNSLNPFA